MALLGSLPSEPDRLEQSDANAAESAPDFRPMASWSTEPSQGYPGNQERSNTMTPLRRAGIQQDDLRNSFGDQPKSVDSHEWANQASKTSRTSETSSNGMHQWLKRLPSTASLGIGRGGTSYFSRHGGRHTLHSTGSPVDTFHLTQDDLLDNACAEALQQCRQTRRSSLTGPGLDSAVESVLSSGAITGPLHTDWSKPHNKTRLRDLCRFIRRLFWAFEDQDEDLQRHSYEDIHSSKPYVRLIRWIMKKEAFGALYFILTIYALFGPDLAAMRGHTAATNNELASINTVVLLLFLLEATFNSLAVPKYFCSGNFWIDMFATLTLVGDTSIANELIESDAAVAGRGTRMARMVRIGGRSSRFVRLMRVARAVQVVRLLPRLQRFMNQSVNELATLLCHKRLWHVFKFLDRGDGVLADQDFEIFQLALHVEFRSLGIPEKSRFNSRVDPDADFVPVGRKRKSSMDFLTDRITQFTSEVTHSISAVSRRNNLVPLNDSQGCIEQILSRPVGQVLQQQCLDDIECMRDSCALLQTAIGRITLKICCIVLSILIAVPLLEHNVIDTSRDQALAALQQSHRDLRHTVNGAEVLDVQSFCSVVDSQIVKSAGQTAKLELLIIDSKIYESSLDGISCAAQAPSVSGDLIDYADNFMGRLSLTPTQMSVHCHPDKEPNRCYDSDVTTLALWNVKEETLESGAASLVYTSIVILMMLLLVIFFAMNMKRMSNHNLFHPLWDLMDDMCALKSMEVIAGGIRGQEDAPTAATVLHKPEGRCSWCSEKPEPAAELLQLQDAFVHLKGAILSWGKYVPTILLKQLYEAGVEATIGCTRCDVTIFFCDIANFEELCHDKTPQQVLHILAAVLEPINTIIEEHNGTLLEFIGDEVLAAYNAPAKVPDHTQEAVIAAIEILDKMLEMKEFSPKLQCSVHRANVLAGNLGSPTRIKYGVMGDGVNLTARLKSLNSRYGTQLLVSQEGLSFEAADNLLVKRPIGNLVLKGRTTPTPTYEVLAQKAWATDNIIEGASKHTEAFKLFCNQNFNAAKHMFGEAHALLTKSDTDGGVGDAPSHHMIQMCERYIQDPPGQDFDGSEHLTKKAW